MTALFADDGVAFRNNKEKLADILQISILFVLQLGFISQVTTALTEIGKNMNLKFQASGILYVTYS
jgi:hypothetical protein